MGTKPPFGSVVDEHGARVLRVCRAVLGGARDHDVDDAWSETFLAAMRAWPSLPADANVEAWIVTIARRKAIDLTRAAARHAVPVADLPEVARTSVGSDTHVLDLDLTAAVATLAPRQREAVVYHFLAGLTYVEVADVVGRRPDAVRRAAADGLAALRRTHPHLAPLEPEEPS